MFFDNDEKFSSLFPSDAPPSEASETTADESTSPTIEHKEEPDSNTVKTDAEHNRKYAQRRLEQKQKRQEVSEIARLRSEIEDLKTAIKPKEAEGAKEEKSAQFLEQFAEDPEGVLSGFLSKQQLNDSLESDEAFDSWVESKYFNSYESGKGVVGEVHGIQENLMILLESIDSPELSPVKNELTFIAKQFDEIDARAIDAYKGEVLRITGNGTKNTPWVQDQLEKTHSDMIEKVSQFKLNYLSDPQFAGLGSHLESVFKKTSTPAELPKNAKQQLGSNEGAPPKEGFKRITSVWDLPHR